MAKVTAPVKEAEKESIYDIIARGYSDFSKYIAEHRLVSSVFDGCKPSFRRMIIGAYEVCAKDYLKSATYSSHVLGKYHPHSLPSLDDITADLVHAGVLLGDGEFGSKYLDGTYSPHANARYTEVKLNPLYKDVFDKILKYVPKVDGEMDHKEYSYVPLPLPYSNNRGGFGLGPGMSVRIPAFTSKSMYEAYKNDDPTLLRSTYGYAILNKDNSLERIWNTGRGSIYYALKVTRKNIGGLQGASISGSAELFIPDFSTINKWRSHGWVTMNEIGTNGVSEIFVGRNKGVTQVSANDIYNELLRISQYRDMVLIKTIAPDNKVHPIGLKTWIGITLKNFTSLLEKYKADMVKKIDYEIQLMKDFDVIKNYIIDHARDSKVTTESIAKATGKNITIVKDIDSWSSSKLRSTVAANEIAKLQKELANVQKFNSLAYTEDLISKIDYQETFVDVDTSKLTGKDAGSMSDEINDDAEFEDETEVSEDFE